MSNYNTSLVAKYPPFADDISDSTVAGNTKSIEMAKGPISTGIKHKTKIIN